MQALRYHREMATAKKTSTTSKTKKKTTPARKAAPAKQPTVTSPVSTPKSKLAIKKEHRPYFIIALVIIILGILLYMFRGLFIVAMVNGQPITRLQLIQDLEKQYGKQALNTLVTKALIQQEAKKQGVSVSDKDVQDEIKKIETSLTAQGQSLDQVLSMQGRTKASIVEDIRLQKLVEKMLAKNITISDKEVNDYIEQNKDSLPEASSSATIKEQIREQLKQQKFSLEVNTWMQNLQKNAKTTYFVNY